MGMPLVHVRHCSKAEFSHWKTHRTQNNPYSEVLGSLTASADRMGTTEQQEQKQQKPTTEKVTQLSSLRIRTKFHSPTHSHSVHAAHTIQVPRVLQLHVSMHRELRALHKTGTGKQAVWLPGSTSVFIPRCICSACAVLPEAFVSEHEQLNCSQAPGAHRAALGSKELPASPKQHRWLSQTASPPEPDHQGL